MKSLKKKNFIHTEGESRYKSIFLWINSFFKDQIGNVIDFRKLWENFLEICSKNKSLVGYTWKELRLNLEAIELKNIYGLNPMAKEFIPRGKFRKYICPCFVVKTKK